MEFLRLSRDQYNLDLIYNYRLKDIDQSDKYRGRIQLLNELLGLEVVLQNAMKMEGAV